jgi:hypothetical protein
MKRKPQEPREVKNNVKTPQRAGMETLTTTGGPADGGPHAKAPRPESEDERGKRQTDLLDYIEHAAATITIQCDAEDLARQQRWDALDPATRERCRRLEARAAEAARIPEEYWRLWCRDRGESVGTSPMDPDPTTQASGSPEAGPPVVPASGVQPDAPKGASPESCPGSGCIECGRAVERVAAMFCNSCFDAARALWWQEWESHQPDAPKGAERPESCRHPVWRIVCLDCGESVGTPEPVQPPSEREPEETSPGFLAPGAEPGAPKAPKGPESVCRWPKESSPELVLGAVAYLALATRARPHKDK